MTTIKSGDLTDKGQVKMVDNPWIDANGNPADRLVTTTKGCFRESQLTIIEKSKKPDIDPLKSTVDFSTVMSVDIRPGRVTTAKRVPKTDKLLHLTIKTSLGTKQVVTNLGEHFEPESFVGNTYMFIMNMNPVTMKGIQSEAMIIASNTLVFNPELNEWVNEVRLININLPIDSTIL
jgi:methionine--tRNA ligase beta chain